MIIIRLEGGLGNQMFQYAFGRHLANKHSTSLKLDLSFYSDSTPRNPKLTRRYYNLDIFNIEATFATTQEVDLLTRRSRIRFLDRAIGAILGKRYEHVMEPHYHYSPAMVDLSDNVYLSGYWQSPKYFADVESDLRREFTFKQKLSAKATELEARLRETNSVCINVRRGDFVGNPLHDVIEADYFYRARSIIAEKLSDYQLFVFSDDIEWCRTHLKFKEPTEFITHDYLGHKFQDYIRLIAACRHFVIPNSSFSWWAVWLNDDPDKIVIAPKTWVTDPNWNTNDLYPNDWIQI